MKRSWLFRGWFLGMHAVALLALQGGPVPQEPVQIGTTPQFFLDDYLVDNRWSLKPKSEEVLRRFHPPNKSANNPLFAGEAGYVTAAHDPQNGLIKLWYQVAVAAKKGGEEGTEYALAYAESKDGQTWTRPKLGLHQWKGSKENNIVWRGYRNARASGPQILELPEKDRRGFRYVLAYRTGGAGKGQNGIRLVGSQDGIRWDTNSDTLIAELHSDTLNSLVYDPVRGEYVIFCRAKDRYLARPGEWIDTGESRRIARLSSKELWTHWNVAPQSILVPDELDMARGFNRFYGMHTRHHAGIYWGFLWPFKLNTDIVTELAWSRDGVDFSRLPTRPRLLEKGPEGAWDDGMVFGSADWIEMGDEWWIFYAGHDGPHEARDRQAGVGLVTLRKEGFISMHGPRGGGVLVTRLLNWPGGKLLVNARATGGELKVRISDPRRLPLPGMDFVDSQVFTGDQTAHEITWKDKSIASLAGQVIRLEFYLRDADLFTFRATGR